MAECATHDVDLRPLSHARARLGVSYRRIVQLIESGELHAVPVRRSKRGLEWRTTDLAIQQAATRPNRRKRRHP